MNTIELYKKLIIYIIIMIFFIKPAVAEARAFNLTFYEPISIKLGQVSYKPLIGALHSSRRQLCQDVSVGDPNYGETIYAVINAVGSAAVTLHVPPGTFPITTDLVIPCNIRLKPLQGAIFSISPGATLTLKGGLDAGPYQIFKLDGTGKVLLGGLIKEIYPEWFNNNLIQTFACASQYSRINFFGKIYSTDGVRMTANHVTLYSPCGAIISQNISGADNAVLTVASDYVTIDGLTISGKVKAGHETDEGNACIFITGEAEVVRKGVTIKNCRLLGKQAGIFTENSNSSVSLSNLTMENNIIRALHWGIMGGNWSSNLPVNNNVRILNNDVAVAAIGRYSGFAQARAIQFINTNNLVVRGNRAIGGFGSIENYGGHNLKAIEAAVINKGGSGYTKGDLLTVMQPGATGGKVTVTAIEANGTISAVELIPSGKNYSKANGVATAGGTGKGATLNITNTGRPYQHNVQIIENITDGHISFCQVSNGCCANNIVDLSLRDHSWPRFDDAAVVKAGGYMPGIEAGDLDNCNITGNVIRNQVAAGITQGTGKWRHTVISNNTIKNIGDPAKSPQNFACGIYLDGPIEDVMLSGNIIADCAMGGIQQIPSTGYPYVKHLVICNNNIMNTNQHGIFIGNADGLNIIGNIISMPKIAAANYDGINFDGKKTVIKNANISSNTIIGGRYGICQPYTDASITRTLLFVNNMVGDITRNSYLVYGKRRDNYSSGVIYVTPDSPPGHIPTDHGFDRFTFDPRRPAKIAHIDGGTMGNVIIISFARADTLLVNDSNYLRLAGGKNATPTAGSAMTFLCVADIDPANNIWIEVSRSMN